eukprot:ctg_706.g379
MALTPTFPRCVVAAFGRQVSACADGAGVLRAPVRDAGDRTRARRWRQRARLAVRSVRVSPLDRPMNVTWWNRGDGGGGMFPEGTLFERTILAGRMGIDFVAESSEVDAAARAASEAAPVRWPLLDARTWSARWTTMRRRSIPVGGLRRGVCAVRGAVDGIPGRLSSRTADIPVSGGGHRCGMQSARRHRVGGRQRRRARRRRGGGGGAGAVLPRPEHQRAADVRAAATHGRSVCGAAIARFPAAATHRPSALRGAE